MLEQITSLPPGKKIYFASDFHLGAPDNKASSTREKSIVNWLDAISEHAEAIVLAGDIFDFWFEYKRAVPRGFVRILGKMAELTDNGVAIVCFTGNHDMWMFNYLPGEMGITIHREPQTLEINGKKILVGHGDGLGPGDLSYKILKGIFANKLCQWAFARIHPNLGIKLAHYWSSKSRLGSFSENDKFDAETDFLFKYCASVEKTHHHDYYIFGHRHLAMKHPISEVSEYVNLGEWVFDPHFAVFDGDRVELIRYTN